MSLKVHKLPAGSLFLALMAILVVSVLGSSFLFQEYSVSVFEEQQLRSDRVSTSLLSGMTYALNNGQYGPQELDLNELVIECQPAIWGAYRRLDIWNRSDPGQNRSALSGVAPNDVALYLCDNDRPLNLCGTTSIMGDAHLPSKGFRHAYIEGLAYSGKGVQGETFRSSEELPKVSTFLLDGWYRLYDNDGYPYEFGIDSFAHLDIMYSEGAVELIDDTLGHNSIMIANEVRLRKTSICKGALIVARSITIDQGAQLSAHLIASERIAVGNDVELGYPSSLILSPRAFMAEPEISLGENTQVHGAIVAVDLRGASEEKLSVTISNGCVVTGVVYCQGPLEVHGMVQGSVYCESFSLRTPTSFYADHLLDARIDQNAFPDGMLLPELFEDPSRTASIAQWLR